MTKELVLADEYGNILGRRTYPCFGFAVDEVLTEESVPTPLPLADRAEWMLEQGQILELFWYGDCECDETVKVWEWNGTKWVETETEF